MIWHWLNTELWGPMWPNIFAPSAITLAAVIVGHVRASRQRQRNHEDMKRHVTEQARGGGGG